MSFIRHITHIVQNILVDALSSLNESLLDVLRRLGGGLHEDEAVLLSEACTFLIGHLAAVVEIGLVADEHDGHGGGGVLAGLFKPFRQV